MKLTRTTQLCAVAFISLTLVTLSATAFWAPNGPELPNFDKRAVGADNAAAVERATAKSALQARVPELQVYFDEHLGTPKWIIAGSGFLSGPGASGLTISPKTTALYATNDPYRATKAFIQEHQSLFGFGPEILSATRVTEDAITAHNGMRTVVWEQDLDGIPIFEGLLISHTTKREELVNLSSQFIPNPAQAADSGTPNRATVIQSPQISGAAAVNAALIDLGETVDSSVITPVDSQSTGADKRQHFTAPAITESADVKLVWLPMNANSMRLCWIVVLTSRARGEMYRSLVDVQTGEVLIRHRLTAYYTDVSYRVYTSDSPSPFSPGCFTPCTTQPPLTNRVLVTLPALDTNASPAGWIDDGGNETRGNNVDAHTDRNADNLPDLPRPQGSPFRTFDFALDLGQAPSTYTNAAVVELFYWNNWMHDKLYQLGFTESARNFQSNNFGRGGVGNDAVQADAQDGSGVNNANFSTPSDGSPGRMQMYLFTGPNPARDGDLDHEVVLHEYTHGLSNRRVGHGVGISALQPSGMGEGWSDWYAMSLLSQPGDDVNAAYATGGYVTYLLSGMNSNYYFGIRRYPYCTDMTKNPLTFKDIDPNLASTHPGVPRSGIVGTTASEVHNQGEVWCVTLWEMRAKLITKYGYSVGNQLALQLVTDGMDLSVANPTFVQARDAILQADGVDTGGANLGELWTAFAKRGMGFGAIAPASSTTSGVVESYVVPLLPVTLTVPHNATEGDAPVLAQVSVSSAPSSNVTFVISCTAPTQVTVPATVTLLAGQTATNFPVAIVDDTLLDGPQPATISVTAPGYATGADTILVADNETAILTLALPAATIEGVGSVLGTLMSSAAPASNITVNLSSSDTTAVQVPATVILSAGQTSVVFIATIVDDTRIDGDQTATITAHVPNWTDALASVIVHDNETTNLMVILPAAAREGDGTLPNAGTVRISGTLTTNLIVSLVSSDLTELTVPPTMTILAGQTSGTFSPTVIDDTEVDGPQTVTVTASAFGFSNGATNMIVNDNESPPIPFNPSPAHMATNVIQTTGLAWASGAAPGEIITNDVYFGTTPTPGPAQLQGSTLGTNWTLPNLLPLTTYYWQIIARKTGVVPGPVWQFTTRGVDHFTWNPIASPKFVSQPFTTTIVGKDIFEATVSNFTGQVSLSGSAGGTGTGNGQILVVQTTATPFTGTVLATLNNLGKSYDFVNTNILSSLNFSNYNTIILGMGGGAIDYSGMASLASVVNAGAKLIILGGSAWADYAAGLNDFFIRVNTNNYNWNTVSGSPKFSVTNPGHALTAGLPSSYNFIDNNASYYMARVTDVSATTVAVNGDGFACLTTKPVGQGTFVMFINIAGDTYWTSPADTATILSTVISNSLFYTGGTVGQSIPIAPTVSGSFSNGAWTGNITALAPTTNLVLRADDGNGHFGLSNPFVVSLQNDISVTVVDSPDPVSLGGHLSYAIAVTNIGPASATSVVVSNILSPSTALISVTSSQGTVTTNGSIIVCNLGTMSGSGSATITIVAQPIAVGTITNQTTVSRGEPDAYLANNSAVAVTAVQTPVISITDVSLYEGNSGTTNAVFTVSVSPPPALPVAVNFATIDGSAVAPGDYIATNGVLNFASGETNKSIRVAVIGDTSYELNETFNVNLSSPSNATFVKSSGLGTILNDDPIPTLSIGDATLAEGNTGTTNAVFAVSLSAPCGLVVSASYATANGNATAGSDYVAKSGSIILPVGVTSTNITVTVNGDLTIEPDEVFYVDLSSAVNATLLKREGYGLILNDDGLPGQLDHFVWSNIGPLQYAGAPFSATISALDAFNNPASAFTGVANLVAFAGPPLLTNYILGNITYMSSGSGSYTLGYSFTPNTNLTVTHVRSFYGTKVSIWDNVGTLLVAQNVSGTVGAWTETPLPTPLVLNAGVTYRIGGYTGGGNYYYRTDGVNTFSNGVIAQSYYATGDAFPNLSNSTQWWLVDLRYTTGSQAATPPLTPAVTGPFTNASWTGNLTVLAAGTNVIVRADDGNGHTGVSAPFNVALQNDISLRMTEAPDPISIGGNITYTIFVTNTGPLSATAVTVTNLLAPTVAFVSATLSQGAGATNGSAVVCDLGTLAGGASATISIVGTATAVGTVTNQATVYRGEADATLINNSAVAISTVQMPTLSINNVSIKEGNSGTTSAVFTVSLSLPAATNVSVSFATADGTATAGSDYIATNGVLNFPVGVTNQSMAVQVIGDTNIEPNETFTVTLSSPINAALGSAVGTGTIVNDETLGIMAYYTDNSTSMTGWEGPITRAGFIPLQVSDISTFDLTTADVLLINESDNSIISSALQARLPQIQAWVNSGGKVVIHDRSTGNLAPNPLLLGYSGTTCSRLTTADLDVIPPGTNLVVVGPFGTINNSTLDGGSSSAHGYILQSLLPPGAYPIISIGSLPTEVACFSYPLGSGLVYYSSIPIDCYLPGGPCGSSTTFALNLQNIYAPNLLVYISGQVGGGSPTAPSIIVQPTNQIVALGSTATFNVTATGTPTLYYQWRKNSVPLAGATASSCVIGNVQTNDVGAYSVVVSNAYGVAISASAQLILSTPSTNVLAQGNLWITLDLSSAGITSLLFQNNEIYRVGTYISDWGLQTGTDGSTFLRNANGASPNIPMTRISGDSLSASFVGNYTAGGANVSLTRDYALLPGADIFRTKMTFSNYGASAITLRCFETFDVDWQVGGNTYYATANDRYTINTNGTTIFVGRSLMTNGPLVVTLATLDPAGIIAASSSTYGGIQSSADLNSFFLTSGADDNGAVRDATIDIGRELTIPSSNTLSFVSYQALGTNIAAAEWALVSNLAKSPLRLTATRPVAGNLALLLSTVDGSPITTNRASHIQLRSSTNLSLSLSNWAPFTVQTILTNGILQMNGVNSNAPARFFRAVETP